MQAYKLQGKIDSSGQLIVTEAIDLPVGDVEIILLREISAQNPVKSLPDETLLLKPKRQVQGKTKIFKEWLENTEPAIADFDPDQARWEALKEDHDL